MSSLCGTARLSRVDLRWLHCLRPLSHAVFVQDCQYIVCWIQDLGLWAFLMFWSACCCFFVFSNCSHFFFCYLSSLQSGCVFTSKIAHSRDPDGFASQRKLFPCVPLKQRPLQQQSVIQVTFKHLENGLRALRKSLVCRLMRRHLLLILEYFAAAEFPLLHTWVCLLWHKLGTPSVWLSDLWFDLW